MQIVVVPAKEIDAMLEGGVGPSLEPDQDCADCGGKFIRWGSCIRMVRRFLKTWKLRVRRVRCKGCGRTHALPPSFCYSNRRDCSEVIWAAITAKAGGRGHRPIADSLVLPHPTVRSWLRRVRDTAKPLRHHFVVLSESFGALASREPPEDSLAALVEAVRTAHFAATSRLEGLRCLQNAEMDQTAPFCLLLLGQPTLRRRLRLGAFAALDQRVGLRYAIAGLEADETASYIAHHLKLAGRSDTLFSDDAVELVH